MSYWFTKTYDHIDAMDMEGFIAGLTETVEVTVGNHPPMVGQQAVREGIGAFWSSINGLKHKIQNVIEQNGLTVLEALIDYKRKDDRTVEIPCVTILERSGEKINSLRIYFDISPVYSQ